MNIIEKIGVLDTYNVDNCSKIRDNKNRIQKMKKTEKISGSKKIYSSPLVDEIHNGLLSHYMVRYVTV